MSAESIFFVNGLGCKLHALWAKAARQKHAALLIHGLSSDAREVAPILPLLNEHGISALAVDLTGHGKSDGTRGYLDKQTILADAAAAADFLKQNGAPSLAAVGHSFGAHAALLALNLLKDFNCAALIAPQLRSGASLNAFKQLCFFAAGAAYNLLPFLPSIFLDNNTKDCVVFVSQDAAEAAHSAGFLSPKTNLKIAKYAIFADNRCSVKQISKPLLVVACEKDRQIPTSTAPSLAALAPQNLAVPALLANAGHCPFFQKELRELALLCAEFISANCVIKENA